MLYLSNACQWKDFFDIDFYEVLIDCRVQLELLGTKEPLVQPALR